MELFVGVFFSCVADEDDDVDIDFLLLFFLEDFHEYFKN